ncbi:MAG TPA: DUF362 domain-containing protein [Polyangiaceae bacterium]|nr:DUF362 domain-containing protein [Polyangiaceae bacterium]
MGRLNGESVIGARALKQLVGYALCGLALAPLGCMNSGSSDANYVVAMLQSSKQQAMELTMSDVAELVGSAVSQSGGLDFIKDGQTVVLKPNLITFYQDAGETLASKTVSGVNTDWRVVKVVADLVRAKNPTGKILIMEGSTLTTPTVYALLGYNSENFGSSVDEFVALEGTGCDDTSTTSLEQHTARGGRQYWINRRYVDADAVIGIPTLATDAWAGIGGAVESLALGATPAGQYGAAENQDVCTRTKIDHTSPQTLGEFIRDYYGIRPADFVVMDGLQGLQHGPLPVWDDSGTYDYASSTKNMRLILASKNAVAVDTIASLVMKCAPNKVPYLTALQTDGLGTTDAAQITVVGKR